MKNLVCMILCGIGAALLASSDGMVNMSAAYVIGSSEESREAAWMVAVGVVVALLATGSIATVLKNKAAQSGVWFFTGVAALFSAVLTIQATSIDYAANDHSGAIESERRSSNRKKIDRYEREIKQLNRKMRECAKDNYFAPCVTTERRIAALSDKIAEISDDQVASKLAQKVDIGDAIAYKAGLPPLWIERAAIYSRAIAVPFLLSILMFGFWTFWGLFWTRSKVTKSVSSGSAPVKKKSLESGLTPKSLPKTENGSDLDAGAGVKKGSRVTKKVTPRGKRRGPHIRNRMKIRTYALDYRAKNGRFPTYKMIKSHCKVGESVISEVMKELKNKAA